MKDRLPPHSIEAEEAVLSLCLIDGYQEYFDNLSPDDFYHSAHQIIFRTMRVIREDGGTTDLVTTVNQLRSMGTLEKCGGASYLARLVETVASPLAVSEYCDIIIDKAIKRKLYAQHMQIANACIDDQPSHKIAIEQRKIKEIEIPYEHTRMSKQVHDWAKASPGEFSVYDIDRDFNIKEPWQKELRTAACEKLVAEGVLQRVGIRRGFYRPCDNELVRQDFIACEDTPSKLWLPFDLNQKIDIFERNIVTLGGEKNAGKTAVMLNIAWCNRNQFNVNYFNSEMGDHELKRRILKSEYPDLKEWSKITFYERARDFSDVIKSGSRDLNIIDFLELSDEFWKVGKLVRDIHDNLGRAIAVIALQKKTGADNPRGGEFVKEKSRLHLDLSNDYDAEYRHKLKINPGKNWHTDQNPNAMFVRFKIVNGNRLIPDIDVDGKPRWLEDTYRSGKAKTI